METQNEWQACNSETFWCEVGSCSHVLQLYENDTDLLNLLEDFVLGGVHAEDCVIVIATKEHLHALDLRLWAYGLNVEALRTSGQYVSLDAHDILSKIMVHGMPDQARFRAVTSDVIAHVQGSGRKLRAFGEMVAILWEQGNSAGMMQLERFWNKLFEEKAFPLLCAYPKNKFGSEKDDALTAIYKVHSKIITHSAASRFDLCYQDVG